VPSRSSIPRTTSSTHSQAEHLHLPIHLLATTDFLGMYPVTPTSSTEASTLIAGPIASRPKTFPRRPNNTIGDQTQVPLRFSSHHTLATTHPLRLHLSTPPQVGVLVVGKTARDRSSAVRTAPTPRSHRGPLRRTLRRVRVTQLELHPRPTSDHTTGILLPHLRRRPLPLDPTELPHQRLLLRATPLVRRLRPRPHDQLNRLRCLKGTTP
jgi:hypothetical protein